MFESKSHSQLLLSKQLHPQGSIQEVSCSPTAVQISSDSLTNPLPLSLCQERLWFHEQSEPGIPIYNIPIAYHLTGQLNGIALQQSLTEIVQRHDILRTTFSILDGQPIQITHPKVDVIVPVVDLRELPPDQQQAENQQLAIEEAQQPFDLIQGLLWRFKLLRLTEENSILLLTLHHIISDHWSLHLLMQELGKLYEAFSTGNPSPLPKLSKQYVDFAIWQRQWMESEKRDSQLAYWQKQLEGNVPALQLPTDQAPALIPTYQGARQSLLISQNLTAALKALSEQEQVTLFMTLLTAFQMLLYQYTKQEDMLLCSPVAGRHRPQTKGLIGYFNNILPLRTDLSGNPSFRELLNRVRQVALGAYKHMDLPFQAIADLPNLVRTPLARAMFALQHNSSQTITLPELSISYPNFQNVHNGTANFDLSLFLEEKEGMLSGAIDYKTDLFNATTITEMIEHFQTRLESLVTNPEQRLSSLPSLRETNLAQPKVETTYVAPQKAIEKTIAAVWQDILQIEKVGIHHNFFDLGGHSLIIAKVCNQLQEVLGKELSVVDLFRYPTIKALAQYLSQEDDGENVAFQQIYNNVQRQKEAFNRKKQRMQHRKKASY